mmetsp:Transcript_66339/g.181947  ORF Transcript_66339/g.181947 Transcript_66339/m.181947 type:complete len:87 (-) Transcript_66339:330-590(-)
MEDGRLAGKSVQQTTPPFMRTGNVPARKQGNPTSPTVRRLSMHGGFPAMRISDFSELIISGATTLISSSSADVGADHTQQEPPPSF